MWGVCLIHDATISHKRIFSHRTFQDCTSKELFCTWKWRTSSIWCPECYFNHCYHIWQWNHTWNPGSYCFDLYVTDENNYIYPSFSAAKWRCNRFWFRCRRRLNHLTNILLLLGRQLLHLRWRGRCLKACVCAMLLCSPHFSVLLYPGIGRLAIRPREQLLQILWLMRRLCCPVGFSWWPTFSSSCKYQLSAL